MAQADTKDQELTADELEAEDVSQLPNREAMSLVSTASPGAVPLPITESDVTPLPPASDATPSATDGGGITPAEPPPDKTGYIGPPVQETQTT